MRMRWLLCVVLGTLAWGQTPPSARPSPQAAPGPAQPGAKMPAPADSSASVSPTAPVLTINGVVQRPQAQPRRRRELQSLRPQSRPARRNPRRIAKR